MLLLSELATSDVLLRYSALEIILRSSGVAVAARAKIFALGNRLLNSPNLE